eukprot:UN23747
MRCVRSNSWSRSLQPRLPKQRRAIMDTSRNVEKHHILNRYLRKAIQSRSNNVVPEV